MVVIDSIDSQVWEAFGKEGGGGYPSGNNLRFMNYRYSYDL